MEIGSGEREARPPLRVLSALFNSSYLGRGPNGPSYVFGDMCAGRGARAGSAGRHTAAAPPPSRRLFLGRTHFSAEKTRGACARRRWGCSWLRLRRRGRTRVLLVGPTSSADARAPRPARNRRDAQLYHQEVSRRPPASQGGLVSAFHAFPVSAAARKTFPFPYSLNSQTGLRFTDRGARLACHLCDDTSEVGINVEILQ